MMGLARGYMKCLYEILKGRAGGKYCGNKTLNLIEKIQIEERVMYSSEEEHSNFEQPHR